MYKYIITVRRCGCKCLYRLIPYFFLFFKSAQGIKWKKWRRRHLLLLLSADFYLALAGIAHGVQLPRFFFSRAIGAKTDFCRYFLSALGPGGKSFAPFFSHATTSST
jgi:hypothetical protein